MGEQFTVQVELKWRLAGYAPAGQGPSFAHTLPAGATVAQLLADLALPAKWVGLVAVNGAKSPPERPLAPGDRVQIYPPFLSGG